MKENIDSAIAILKFNIKIPVILICIVYVWVFIAGGASFRFFFKGTTAENIYNFCLLLSPICILISLFSKKMLVKFITFLVLIYPTIILVANYHYSAMVFLPIALSISWYILFSLEVLKIYKYGAEHYSSEHSQSNSASGK